MTAYTGRHALPYAEATDGVKASRAAIQTMTELLDTKLDIQAFATNGRRVRNLALYDESVSNGTGFIVIQTPMIFDNVMTRLHITGWVSNVNNTALDLILTFYPFSGDSNFANYDVKNNGSMRIKTVHLLTRTSDGKIAIALEPDTTQWSGFWEYPKIVVDGIFGHNVMSDVNLKTGWSISRVANLSAYTAKRTLDPRPVHMRAYAGAAQVVGNGTWVQNNQWLYDTQHTGISLAAPGNFTVLKSGLYLMEHSVMFRNDAASNGVRGAQVRRNNVEFAGHYSAPLAGAVDYVSASYQSMWPLNYGDVITFWVLQTSGANLTLHSGQWTHCAMTLIK